MQAARGPFPREPSARLRDGVYDGGGIVEHSQRMAIPGSLQELGVPLDALPAMAADCVDSYPRPNHPTPIDQPGVLALLERMYAGEPIEAWHDSFRPIDSEVHA